MSKFDWAKLLEDRRLGRPTKAVDPYEVEPDNPLGLPWRREGKDIYNCFGVCVCCMTALTIFIPPAIDKNGDKLIDAINAAWAGRGTTTP